MIAPAAPHNRQTATIDADHDPRTALRALQATKTTALRTADPACPPASPPVSRSCVSPRRLARINPESTPRPTVMSATEAIRGSARPPAPRPGHKALKSTSSSLNPTAPPPHAAARSSGLTPASRCLSCLASIGISRTAAPASRLGIRHRLSRSLDPHLDPARAAVALDDNDRAEPAVNRFRKLELDRNLGLVDRLKRLAVSPGKQLHPPRIRGLDAQTCFATAEIRRW